MFKFSLDILFGNILTYIEASTACTCVTLFTDVAAALFFFLVFVKTFLCTDGQITIFQCGLNFIFCEARKVNHYLVAIIQLANICFHHMAGFAAIQFLFCILHLFVIIIERKIVEKVIK